VPWLAWVYVALVVIASIWGFYEDVHSRRARYWLPIDLLTTSAWLFFIAAYYNPSITTPLGRWTVVLFAAALVLTGLSAQQQIAEIDRSPDPELSPTQNFIGDLGGIVLGVGFFAPALVFGALVTRRALGDS
jgi:4-amino-4-deoxy-L-arabinose transferase-like glycosyltransferase